MLLDREGFQKFARDLGIDNDSKVVVYDEKYDATSLWWAFHLYGKTDVRVLDGGYPAWKAVLPGADTPLRRARARRPATSWPGSAAPAGWPSMDDVRRAQAAKEVRVWDAREPAEWSGSGEEGQRPPSRPRPLGRRSRAGRSTAWRSTESPRASSQRRRFAR